LIYSQNDVFPFDCYRVEKVIINQNKLLTKLNEHEKSVQQFEAKHASLAVAGQFSRAVRTGKSGIGIREG
jgi:hypothetical protein